jgi:integrase
MPRRNQGPRLSWLEKRRCFYITWTEDGRSRERSTGATDREQAEIVFADFLQARGRRNGPSDPSEMLVTDMIADYARERGPKVTAPQVMGRAIDMLTSFWEGRMVADIRPETCSLYRERRGRAAATVRRELGVLQAAINHAYKNGKLTRSLPVELPKSPPPRDRWLTRREAARLFRASRTNQARLYMPLFILLGLYTGRRKEAILSLRWPQVDLEAGLIDFEVPGRELTKKRRGKVPIPAKLLPHLRRAQKRGSDLGYVLHINGKRIGNIKKGFAAACCRAGLDGVSPHTLRHTAATWLMQAGVTHWQAAGYLAMSEKTLREVYGHHHPDYLREAAEALSKRPQFVRRIIPQ